MPSPVNFRHRKYISQLNQAHLDKGWLSGDKAANARVQLLYAVNHHNWKPTETADVSSFSDALKDSVVSGDIESRFASMILADLRFTGLPDRLKAIPCTHPGTFQWTFDGSYQRTDSRDYESFPRWCWEEYADEVPIQSPSDCCPITNLGQGKTSRQGKVFLLKSGKQHAKVAIGPSTDFALLRTQT
jgi:hypothetical protein